MNNGGLVFVGYTGDAVRQSPPGSKFQQVQLMGLYQFHPGYEDMGIRLNAGIARQISGPIYSTFGIDIHAFTDSLVHPYLSWSFVPRGDFGSGEPGWSHTVTLNIALRLFK
jgi:hypothetical protein